MDNPIVIEIETPEQACETVWMYQGCEDCPVQMGGYCEQVLFDLIRERGMIVEVKEE